MKKLSKLSPRLKLSCLFKIILNFQLCVLLIPSVQSQISNGYYDFTQGLVGDELKLALYNIINGHTEFPYTSSNIDIWDILKMTDKYSLNTSNVILKVNFY